MDRLRHKNPHSPELSHFRQEKQTSRGTSALCEKQSPANGEARSDRNPIKNQMLHGSEDSPKEWPMPVQGVKIGHGWYISRSPLRHPVSEIEGDPFLISLRSCGLVHGLSGPFRLLSSLSVTPDSIPWLCFRLDGKTYAFAATIFGFKISAYVAAKTSLELAKVLRRLFPHLTFLVWVDDFLIAGLTKDSLLNTLWNSIIPLILALGFKISWPKSFLEPNTRRVYMGFVIDSLSKRLYLTEKRVDKISALLESSISRLVAGHGITARILARILGSITAAAPALPTAKFAKPLRSPLGWKRLKWAWDFLVVPADLTVCTLTFLWFHVKQNTGRFYLRPDDVQVIATDASKSSKFTGWGVAMDQNNELITLGARFEDEQTSFSIATLELMAFINAIPLALENGLLKPGHPPSTADRQHGRAQLCKEGLILKSTTRLSSKSLGDAPPPARHGALRPPLHPVKAKPSRHSLKTRGSRGLDDPGLGKGDSENCSPNLRRPIRMQPVNPRSSVLLQNNKPPHLGHCIACR